MKVKTQAPKEDPETKARRLVEEARAEADKTSAMQGLLDRRARRVLRIFGKAAAPGAATGGVGSGASGVIATPPSNRATFGGDAGERFASKATKFNQGYLY